MPVYLLTIGRVVKIKWGNACKIISIVLAHSKCSRNRSDSSLTGIGKLPL